MSKIAKSFFVSLILLLIIVFIIAAFLPDHFTVSRSTSIQSKKEQILSLLSDFSTWNRWSPWFEAEPTAQYKVDGFSGQVGSSISWAGKIVGTGKITLANRTPNQVKFDVEISKPNHLSLSITIDLTAQKEETTVRWTNQGYLSYPMGRLFGPFMDRMLGSDIQRGLTNLKKAVETKH